MASAPDNALVCLGPIQRGRPSTYTDELATEICERIASGELLIRICEEDGMPNIRTVSRWLMRRPEFYAQYADARETQQHLETEEMRSIADDVSILPEHKRIMLDARKWRAERLAKRFYGNSTKLEIEQPVRAPAGAEEVPAGIAWIRSKLLGGGEGPEPDPGAMGEG